MALMYAVFGAFVAASMVSVMLTMATVTRRGSDVKQAKVQALYLAEGAIEAAKKVVQESIANWEAPPETGEAVIGEHSIPYSIEPTGVTEIVTDRSGIQTILTGYEIVATANTGGAQHMAHRVINAESTPIFQFAVFYTTDLEIQPGPNMVLGGRVHSNGDMYLGSGGTLTMNTNYVRARGDIYRKRKNNDDSNGRVKIRRWVEDPFDGTVTPQYREMLSRSQMGSLGIDTSSGYDSDFTEGHDRNGDGDFDDEYDWMPFVDGALEYWSQATTESQEGNTVMTGAHGVGEAVSPNTGSIKMYEPSDVGNYIFDSSSDRYVEVAPGTGDYSRGFYHDNADLAIIMDASGTSWEAYDREGNDLTAVLQAANVVSIGSLYDARQSENGDQTPVLEVDIGQLNRSGVFPANGLLYTGSYGLGEGTDARGVQVVNGGQLAGGLTLVTESSAYIQGDFNTQDKKPAAVIGDAVNLLSNSWNGSKTQGTLPAATSTTYNVAIITGNHETVGSSYNGGLENLPRFHEDWRGINCNIFGSFVNTWESELATGQWAYGGDRYKAPNRRWSYDPMFNNVANLPPFTPMVVTASDVVSW